MTKTHSLAAICAFALLGTTAIHATTRENEFGAGAVVSSFAGAGLASVSQAAATHLNPANLARCKKSQAEVGVRYLSTVLDVAFTSGTTSPPVKQLGSLFVLELGGCAVAFDNIGIGVWSSSNALDPMAINMTTPKSDIYLSRFNRDLGAPTMMAGFGYAFIPELSIGLALSIAMNALITQDVYAPLYDNGNTFSAELGATVKPRAAIVAGLSFNPWEFAGIGATLRTADYGKLDIDAKNVAVAPLLPVPVRIEVDMKGPFNYSPTQFAVGIFYTPIEMLTLVADLNYDLWSDNAGPFLKVTPKSSVSGGMPFRENEPSTFKNTLVPKIGIEVKPLEALAIRAGYKYQPAIVSLPMLSENLVDNDTHTISLGGGYRFQGESLGFHADIFAATHIMPRQSIQKDAGNGSLAYSFGGVVISSGLNAGVDF